MRIDAGGKQCPIPVIMAKKELEAGEQDVEIIVDGQTQIDNLARLGDALGRPATSEPCGDKFLVKFANGETKMGAQVAEADTYAVFFNTNAIGNDSYDQVPQGTSKPSNTRVDPVVKGWRMPSVTDLRYVFQGLGGPSATSPVGVQDTRNYGTGSTLLNAINTACGNSNMQSSWYYLSSRGSSYELWNYRFDKGQFWDYPANGFYTRAVFAY